MPAFGVVVRVDPDSTVLPHPGDEFFVLDADYVGECLNLIDQRYGVSNQTKRPANVGAQRLVNDERWIASGVQGMVRRRFSSPIGGPL